MILVRDGTVLTAEGWARMDVLIEGGKVSRLGTGLEAEAVVDATGCFVGPGFVDLHTHLREPGETWKEDIASGSAAAVAGGFTAVVAMPNTDPPIDKPKIVDEVVNRGREIGLVDVHAAGAMTVGRAGAVPTDLESLYERGVRLFTDDGDCVTDGTLLREIMTRIARLSGALVAQHAEEHTLTAGGHMHQGEMSRRLGIAGLEAEAESVVVERDLDLVAETGASYHCQHVSSAGTVELLRKAHRAGLGITSEVTPHHLTFDESHVYGLDTNFKMYPPLRSVSDRETLIEALADGTIDAVATDHAPHSVAEKAVAFTEAPRGVIGMETAASAVWETLRDHDRLFAVLSTVPAQVLGLEDQGMPLGPGCAANIVVFDPNRRWIPLQFESKSANSPYQGREMTGKVTATIHDGDLVHGRLT